MSFTFLLPFLYHFTGREGGVKTYHDRLESEGGNLTHTKAKFREGVYLIAGKEQDTLRGREAGIAGRRVSIAGEQFLCRRREVSYQREEEAERQKTSILSDKVATFPVCFKFVPNRGRGELYL